jgi:hypothetical protein
MMSRIRARSELVDILDDSPVGLGVLGKNVKFSVTVIREPGGCSGLQK